MPKVHYRVVCVALLTMLASMSSFSAFAQPARASLAPVLTSNHAKVIKDRYIVVIKDEVTAQVLPGLEERARANGGRIHFHYETALKGFAATLPAPAVERLRADPRVAYIEADQVITTAAVGPWGLDRIDQRNLPLNDIYSYARSGAGVHAYVLDSGIRATHTEFAGRVGVGYDAINDGYGTSDCTGHGTHVAGTIGGTNYGVAKSVTLHPVRVLDCNGEGSYAAVTAGIDWVTAHRTLPAVANLSLGGPVSSNVLSMETALRNMIAAGVTTVVAAGNAKLGTSPIDACNVSPARVAEAITVGATDSSDTRASYSNYGPCLDIFAPGSAIKSAGHTSDTASEEKGGTSMASPHVAGVAALYLEANPSTSPATVTNAILSKATPNIVTNPGSGSPNLLLYSLVPQSICGGAATTIEGTGADDTIYGTEGNDVIFAYGGNDYIEGRGGNDIVCANQGTDTVLAGIGVDLVYGGQDADTIHGNAGDDTINGDKGNDIIYGGQDNDTIYGGDDNDTIDGNLGYDAVDGQAGTDSCTAEVTYNCP